jgi:diguanylate cyclase (GGDEF)-like protein
MASPFIADQGRAAARLEVAWRGTSDALWDWEYDTGTFRVSERWVELVGNDDGPDPSRWFRRVHPEDRERLHLMLDALRAGGQQRSSCELRLSCEGGRERWFQCTAVVCVEACTIGGSLRDITDERRRAARALDGALHDSLTGLDNRDSFVDRLGVALTRARSSGGNVSVYFLDLDRFQKINDSLGHEAGDRLLVSMARRLRRVARTGDVLARLGSDKFGMLSASPRDPEAALRLAQAIETVLSAPIILQGQKVFPTASIGVAFSADHVGPEEFLNDAYAAMHRAKGEEGPRQVLFDPSMNAKAKDNLRLEAELRRAIERREFVLHYQPVVSLEDGRLRGLEALVRWQHPERGLLPPFDFIPVAEETGLVVPLGWRVLEEACKQIVRWHAEYPGRTDLTMAVNVSAKQFREPDLVERLAEMIEDHEIPTGVLHLEMTESVIMEKTRANAEVLRSLRELGLGIQIDDFGTGYSSLSALHAFPIDTLKIDRSFVSRLGATGDDAAIVRAILDLGRGLGMDVVAEGIETTEQRERLRDLGCGRGQGYLFSAPVEPAAIAAFLDAPPAW